MSSHAQKPNDNEITHVGAAATPTIKAPLSRMPAVTSVLKNQIQAASKLFPQEISWFLAQVIHSWCMNGRPISTFGATRNSLVIDR